MEKNEPSYFNVLCAIVGGTCLFLHFPPTPSSPTQVELDLLQP